MPAGRRVAQSSHCQLGTPVPFGLVADASSLIFIMEAGHRHFRSLGHGKREASMSGANCPRVTAGVREFPEKLCSHANGLKRCTGSHPTAGRSGTVSFWDTVCPGRRAERAPAGRTHGKPHRGSCLHNHSGQVENREYKLEAGDQLSYYKSDTAAAQARVGTRWLDPGLL